jgi:hypothetical protein
MKYIDYLVGPHNFGGTIESTDPMDILSDLTKTLQEAVDNGLITDLLMEDVLERVLTHTIRCTDPQSPVCWSCDMEQFASDDLDVGFTLSLYEQ